jgi:hypothetical protein
MANNLGLGTRILHLTIAPVFPKKLSVLMVALGLMVTGSAGETECLLFCFSTAGVNRVQTHHHRASQVPAAHVHGHAYSHLTQASPHPAFLRQAPACSNQARVAALAASSKAALPRSAFSAVQVSLPDLPLVSISKDRPEPVESPPPPETFTPALNPLRI